MSDDDDNNDSDDSATTPSEQAFALIRRFEGFSPKPYLCPAGKPTIGYGHLIRAGETFDSLTQDQAETLLEDDAGAAGQAALDALGVPLTQCRLDGLTSFVFNIGAGAFARSTLCQVIQRGWHDEVPMQLLRWVYVNGKPMQGLIARRRAEGDCYGRK